MDAFYHYRVIGILLDYMRLNLFHKDNPNSKKQRKEEFLSFIGASPYSDALANLDPSRYWLERQFLLNSARKRRFSLLAFTYRNLWTLKLYGGIMNRINRLKAVVRREGSI